MLVAAGTTTDWQRNSKVAETLTKPSSSPTELLTMQKDAVCPENTFGDIRGQESPVRRIFFAASLLAVMASLPAKEALQKPTAMIVV